MQFLSSGPDIPDALIQSHEDGNVVFLCGAGLSRCAGLPTFRELVERLYRNLLHEELATVQKAAIPENRLDIAVGLLEGQLNDGRMQVRREIARLLEPNFSQRNATTTHEALLTLARNRRGVVRLVTTNFDRIFEHVITSSGLAVKSDVAPALPIPKRRWDSLVYLHGLIPQAGDLNELDKLVVSSGDFGLAYLHERWAARFVSDLFREYTVCFVGYSLDDPVLRYMTDAYLADHMRGEARPLVYAFDCFARGSQESAKNKWRARGVIPILYKAHRNHYYLHQSIRDWAKTYRDGLRSRQQMVARLSPRPPSVGDTRSLEVGQIIWALSHASAVPARFFARSRPAPPLSWLCHFDVPRFTADDLAQFGCGAPSDCLNSTPFSFMCRPTPQELASSMALVSRRYQWNQLDSVMQELANWLGEYVDDPELLLWVARSGGTLHPQFSEVIDQRLRDRAIPTLMRTLWRLVLLGRVHDELPRFDADQWANVLQREGLSNVHKANLRGLLAPRIHIKKATILGRLAMKEARPEDMRVHEVLEWEIRLGSDDVHATLQRLSGDPDWPAVLPQILGIATDLLEETIGIMSDLGSASATQDRSFMVRPSIGPHQENNEYTEWTALITLLADAWVATASVSPARAALEVERWRTIEFPVFQRLAMFAASQGDLIPTCECLDILCARERWWLWSMETRRETLQLIAAVAPRLDELERERLSAAMLEVPPRAVLGGHLDDERWHHVIEGELWLRLCKWRQSGAVLAEKAEARWHALSTEHADWPRETNDLDDFVVRGIAATEMPGPQRVPAGLARLKSWLKHHPTPDDWNEDDWPRVCTIRLHEAATALGEISAEGEWPVARWRQALQAWGRPGPAASSWSISAMILAGAPEPVLMALAPAVADWIATASSEHAVPRDELFVLVWRILSLDLPYTMPIEGDHIFASQNNPSGILANVILDLWRRDAAGTTARIPEDVLGVITALADPCVARYSGAQVAIAARAASIRSADSAWFEEHLSVQFDWSHSADAACRSWQGLLWYGDVDRGILEHLRGDFIAVAEQYDTLGSYGSRYAELLVRAALELQDVITLRDFASVCGLLPTAGLERAAIALVHSYATAGEGRGEYWKDRVLPLILGAWPRRRESLSANISMQFANLCLIAPDVFPEVLQNVRHWLMPLGRIHAVVQRLGKTSICREHPEAALEYLWLIVDRTSFLPSDLGRCLQGIKDTGAIALDDPRLEALQDFVARRTQF